MPNEGALGTSTAPAPAAPPAGGPDAPLLPQDSSVFDSWAKANEGIADPPPEGTAAAPAKESEAPAADKSAEPAAPDTAKPDGEADDAAATGEKEKTATDEAKPEGKEPAAPEAPVIALVADEPFETFTEKVDKFFDAYDVDPSIVAMKEGYTKQIEALTAQVGNQAEINDDIKAAVEAVAAIDGFRKDETTGRVIPKTTEVVAFVQANKSPEVFKQLVTDAMSAPSQKYKHLGFTMLHEYYVDAGVPPAKMDEFIKYVSGEAVPPSLHPDLPEGVPVEVAEAYGKNSALRKAIEDCAETLKWDENDRKMYPEQYQIAKTQFDDAIAALQAAQNGINKERNDKIADKKKAIDDQQTFNNTVTAGTQEIQKAELANFGKDLDEKLQAFIPDPAARTLAVLETKQTMVNVFADDIYGADARAELKTLGINVEFAKAQTIFQQIQDAVALRQQIFDQTGDKEAADKAVAKDLTNALRELGIMRRNVAGKIALVKAKQYVTTGLKPAGDKPTLRPTLKGGQGAGGAKTGNAPNYQNPTEAGKWYRDNLFGGEQN